MKRDNALDSLRGLMLVVMTIDHFGGPMSILTRQTIGFISAAEGFVFLSGFVAGLVYGRSAMRDSLQMAKKAYKRASVIYLFHLGLLSFAGLLFLASSVFARHLTGWAPLFQVNWLKAMLLGTSLLYQPRYMDILPMYVIFLMLIPLLVTQFEKGREALVLLASAILWISVQAHVRAALPQEFAAGTAINLGYFDIFAWQLLFVYGSWFGYRRAIGRSLGAGMNNGTIVLSLVAALLLFLVRHGYLTMPELDIRMAADRGTLAGLRLLNFSIIALLIGSLNRRYGRFFNIKWLAFLGQHSLQVFAFHVAILYLMVPVRWKIENLGGLAETLVCLAFVVSLTLPAMLHRYYRNRIYTRNVVVET